MAFSEAINQISTRMQALGFKKSKATEEEQTGTSLHDKSFFIENPGGGGFAAEYGAQKYDVTEEVSVIISLPLGDDYISDVQTLGTNRESVVKDLINKDSWATGTSGIALIQYTGHSAEKIIDDGSFLRDELNFSVRIRRSL